MPGNEQLQISSPPSLMIDNSASDLSKMSLQSEFLIEIFFSSKYLSVITENKIFIIFYLEEQNFLEVAAELSK